MMTRDVERRVEAWMGQHDLSGPGQTVLVALSGGADSVCLTRILLALAPKLNVHIGAAHYNHGLRGEESDRDQQFVVDFCASWDIPLTLGGGDVARQARETGRGVEETAREMRYAFLRRAAAETGADRIATAHNADDNVETILLNLVRGSGTRGLAGIPICREGIIRPLLPVERGEVEAYLAGLGQDYVSDSTNSDSVYRRNALRHGVLPQLRQLNPGLAKTLLRQSSLLRQDGEYLDRQADQALDKAAGDTLPIKLPVGWLMELEPPIASRVIIRAVERSGGRPDYDTVERALALARSENPSGRADLSGGITLRREYDGLVIAPCQPEGEGIPPRILPCPGSLAVPEAKMTLACEEIRGKNPDSFNTLLFKCDGICDKITVRSRQPGDRIALAGRGGSKTLKKLFIEQRIPAHLRDTIPVLADGLGPIAVLGLGVDRRVAPGAGDDHLLAITWEKL